MALELDYTIREAAIVILAFSFLLNVDKSEKQADCGR